MNINDDKVGACVSGVEDSDFVSNAIANSKNEVIYIGDPMCSWCWAIYPALKELQAYCSKQNLPFTIVLGGLRSGGEDTWNDDFKGFLRSHWKRIEECSGQPFGYKLLDKKHFIYDTEPACRAVVSARIFLKARDKNTKALYAFFASIQRKFYVDNEDPKQPEFYRDLCEDINIDFNQFLEIFNSQEAKAETTADFEMSRNWGVTSYPTILLQTKTSRSIIASGFVQPQQMIKIIEQKLK